MQGKTKNYKFNSSLHFSNIHCILQQDKLQRELKVHKRIMRKKYRNYEKHNTFPSKIFTILGVPNPIKIILCNFGLYKAQIVKKNKHIKKHRINMYS